MREILNNIIYMAKRFKLATSLNIIGLIVAFASFYLLLTQVIYQLTYNHGLEDYQRLYRMESSYDYNDWNYSDNVCRPFAEALKLMPQVESFSLMRDINGGANTMMPFIKGDKPLYLPYTIANATALSTLGGRAIAGKIQWPDKDQNGIIIPASIAREYFDSVNVVGENMLHITNNALGLDTTEMLNVYGVYEDFPENSEIPNCIYSCMDSIFYYDFYSLYKCYVKFKAVPDDVESLGDSLKSAIIKNLDENADHYSEKLLNENKQTVSKTNFKFTPLSESYFVHTTYTSGDHGFWLMVVILALACLLIIVIATINFLNFTLAESPMRMRSVNTRLVLGAERYSMRVKIVIECVIIAVTACLLGLAICNLLQWLPVDNLPLIGSLKINDNWFATLLTLLLAILAGTAAGTYPAIFATSFPPALVLKGTFGLTPHGRKLRTILVCMQVFISMLMVIYIGIMFLQSQHILNMPYGFDKGHLLYSDLKEDAIETDDREQLKQDLMQISDVEDVTFTSTLLGATDGHYTIKTRFHGEPLDFNVNYIDQNFIPVMGIKMIDGRTFTDSDPATAVIINEALRHKWPWIKPGAYVPTSADDYNNDSAVVVGVCEDIRYGTTRVNSDQPFAFILDRDNPGDKLLVRIAAGGDMEQARQLIDQRVQRFSHGKATEVAPYDNGLTKTYGNELRFFSQVYLIGLFCLVITLIGLFCIMMFETEYRCKEIAIRKVAGATTGEIVWMLCRRYGWLILICFAVAAPVAGYLGNKTLGYFAERASISSNWWIFPLSLLLVGGIMLGTLVLQGWLAAHKNPVANIKTE